MAPDWAASDLCRFFLLAPVSLRNELFTSLFVRRFSHPFTLYCSDDPDIGPTLENATRPDLLFVSEIEAVAIEMRQEAEGGLTEVLRHALLGLAVEMYVGAPRRHCLALVGARDFPSQWREHYSSVTELKLALARVDPAPFLAAQPARFHRHEDRFMAIVASLDMAFLSYAELAAFLRDAVPPEDDMSPDAQVCRKIIEATLEEFERRGLVK